MMPQDYTPCDVCGKPYDAPQHDHNDVLFQHYFYSESLSKEANERARYNND